MHRWLRVLICLLLVCCILVNLSPLRAEAVSATAIACSVAIPLAVAIGLQAVGVRQGSDSTAFNNVVSSAVDALSPEWAVNGLSTMLALTTDGSTKTFANRNFLQSILDFLYDSGILNLFVNDADFLMAPDYSFYLDWAREYSYWGVARSYDDMRPDSRYFVYVFRGSSPFILSNNGQDIVPTSGGTFSYYSNEYYNSWKGWRPGSSSFIRAQTDSRTWTYIEFFSGDSLVGTSEDLTLESVGHDIETDYETYVETGIVGVDFGVQFEDDPNTDRNEEDDGNDLWLPVGIPGGSTDGSYTDQTQQDAQSGNTPQDVLDELLQNSGSGDGSGDGTGSDSGSGNGSGNTWKPPSDHNVFALADLSKFFPFCIPFDLYDFFTLLNAEPVAPVLSWEIKDLAGQTYSLDVDLSQWDSVALLFRRLQLFLFITGLAAASRKFIKW